MTIRPDSAGPTETAGGDEGAADRTLRYDEVERARTVFELAVSPKPGGKGAPSGARRPAPPKTDPETNEAAR